MATISVVYHYGTGHTKKMAEAPAVTSSIRLLGVRVANIAKRLKV